MAANATLPSTSSLPPLPSYTLTPLPPLVPWISDFWLSLLLPVVAYWAVSGFFHLLDVYDLLPQYRLHTPAEITARNHVTRWECFRDVLVQQAIQTATGFVLSLNEPVQMTGRQDYDVAVWATRIRVAQRGLPVLMGMLGLNAAAISESVGEKGHRLLAGALAGGVYPFLTRVVEGGPEGAAEIMVPAFAAWELLVAKAIYWAVIPTLQFVVAVLFMDTWQYWLHRTMHMNKWMYTTFHSRHHRLYVPYAYGALYNHPFEGFLLDTAGTGLAYLVAGMTPRQAILLFTSSTIKTVDDHCGYSLPWDPLQWLTSNNAAYHDIHHQSWGIKTNFSQPFFTFWDAGMGTMWRGETKLKYDRDRSKAAAKEKAKGAPMVDAVEARSEKKKAR